MNGFAKDDVSAAASGFPMSVEGRLRPGPRGCRKGSPRSGLALLAVCAVAIVSLQDARGGQSLTDGRGLVASGGDAGAVRAFDSVLLNSPGSTASESVISDEANAGDGFLATDESVACPPCAEEPIDALPFSEGLDMHCPGLCCHGCGPVWGVQVDALMLWRQNQQSTPLFLDSTGAVALDADQVQPSVSAGPRVGVIRRLGPCVAVEGNYFNVSPFAGQSVLPAAGGLFTMTNFGDLVFDDVTSAQLNSSARIQSAELNWRRSVGPVITWLAGFRWVQWNEQMDASYRFANTNPDNLGSGSTTTATGNDLYGGQLGVDVLIWDRCGPLKISGLAKGGVFGNVAYVNSGGNFVPQPGFGSPYALPAVAASATDVAFFGEAGLNATYWLTSWLAWRAGYTVFWLDGVAVAPQQFALANYGSGTTTINTNGSVLLHGATTGLEARW